ncbi:unnamed protein product, partial [Vitis vinifera]
MPERNVVSWTSVIAGYSQNGQGGNALEFYFQMLQSGVMPDQFTFGSIIKACSSLGDIGLGRQLHAHVLKSEFGAHIIAQNALISMYTKSNLIIDALDVFSRMATRDLISWGSMIAGFSQLGYELEALCYFKEMLHQGRPDLVAWNAIIAGFAYGELRDAIFFFEEMRCNADLVSWNAILTACMRHDQAEEVFRLLKLMCISQHRPDYITLTNVLGASAETVSIEIGNQVHCYALKTGLNCDTSVTNGLIDLYAKCGSLKTAHKIFDSMINPDVVSWSSLILGYAQFGYGEEALKLFKTMRRLDVKPNHVTFVGVLTACSHVGLVEEGWKLYGTMEKEFGIAPTREHCSCMVDLLARAGCLNEAEGFIHQMAFDPDIVVWKTLLAACKTHGNVDVGKRAAENILKIDPSNSAAHVLLCNIYASKGNWEDVARLRSLMKQRGVRKVPGQSWIEVKDRIHVFFVEDSLHPERNKIYTMLEELLLQMLDAGYVPFQK